MSATSMRIKHFLSCPQQGAWASLGSGGKSPPVLPMCGRACIIHRMLICMPSFHPPCLLVHLYWPHMCPPPGQPCSSPSGLHFGTVEWHQRHLGDFGTSLLRQPICMEQVQASSIVDLPCAFIGLPVEQGDGACRPRQLET